VALQPNVLTNPLGIYYASGPVNINANATFQGTLMAWGDLTVSGTGVSFNPISLPALYNTTTPVQLPVAVSSGQFSLQASSTASVNGQMLLGSTFNVAAGPQAAMPLTFTGQLIAGSIYLHARSEWTTQSTGWWNGQYNSFSAHVGKTGGTNYFPDYLRTHASLDPTPRVIVKPSASTIRYHWQTWMNAQNSENPLFVPASGDPGLRWDLLQWTENPPSS
jgi:hypothetical protein